MKQGLKVGMVRFQVFTNMDPHKDVQSGQSLDVEYGTGELGSGVGTRS